MSSFIQMISPTLLCSTCMVRHCVFIAHVFDERCYSNTTVYYGIHKRSECIPVDCGVTNLIHDRRSCVDFTLEVKANVAPCVHSSVNKPGVKRNSGL